MDLSNKKVREALEEVLDTPLPELAVNPSPGALMTVGHGNIPDRNIILTLDHLLTILSHKIQHTVLANTRVSYWEASLPAWPWSC